MTEHKIKGGDLDIMKKIASLNNQGKTFELNEYLATLDIESNTSIAEMAVTAFEITKENIGNNVDLANKLSKLEHKGMRESLRSGLIEEILKDMKLVS